MQAERAPNTLLAYERQWAVFVHWCAAHDRNPLPASPETVGLYGAWNIDNGYRLETVRLRIAAIRYEHKRNKLPTPVDDSVRDFLRNAARSLKEKSRARKPLTADQLATVSRSLLTQEPRGEAIMFRAIIVLGWRLGWRRSELVALNLNDIEFTPQGVIVHIGASKADQTGAEARDIALPFAKHELTCPVVALKAWVELRGKWAGPLFVEIEQNRSKKPQPTKFMRARLEGERVLGIVKRCMRRAGFDAKEYGAHSLRSGMVTTGIENGANILAIMHRTGHRNVAMLKRYTKIGASFLPASDPLSAV